MAVKAGISLLQILFCWATLDPGFVCLFVNNNEGFWTFLGSFGGQDSSYLGGWVVWLGKGTRSFQVLLML